MAGLDEKHVNIYFIVPQKSFWTCNLNMPLKEVLKVCDVDF